MPKTPFLRHLYGQNLAIFLAVRLRFYLRFSALFPTGTRLACNPLTESLTLCALASCAQNRLHVGRTAF